MERAEKFEEVHESKENSDVYHFKEFVELEPAFIDLVKSLKDEIDKNTYDTLISDDVGGRLPTLALREVIKERTKKSPDTFFLPFGRTAENKNVEDAIKKLVKKSEKTLIVTEYTMTGNTLYKMVEAFDRAGLHADVAVAFSSQSTDELEKRLYESNEFGDYGFITHAKAKLKHFGHRHKIFIGKSGYFNIPLIDENAQKLTGVHKSKTQNGQLKLYSDKKYAKTHAVPKNAVEQIQKRINESREDVKLLAKKVVDQVWGKKENET